MLLSKILTAEYMSNCDHSQIFFGNSLVAQWLEHCISTTWGLSSIPEWGTKILQAAQGGQKRKEKKRKFPSHTALLDNHSVLDISIFVKVKVTQSCPAFCDPVDYTIHGILQARILEWLAIPFSRGSSQPRDRTQVSRTAGGLFTSWANREAQEYCCG